MDKRREGVLPPAVQGFRPCAGYPLGAYDEAEMHSLADAAAEYVPSVQVRGCLIYQRQGDKELYQVVKRDGKIVEFDINKIAAAIKKAFDATGTDYNDSVIDFLALKVSADFLPKIKDGKVAVEDIQDSVEAVLSAAATRQSQSPTSSTASSARSCATPSPLTSIIRRLSTSTSTSRTGASKKTPPSPIRWADSSSPTAEPSPPTTG